MRRRIPFAALIVAGLALAACGGGASPGGSRVAPPTLPGAPAAAYHHVVVVIQENRSFDNMFAGAAKDGSLHPAVDTVTHGYNSICGNATDVTTCTPVPLAERGFGDGNDPDHNNDALVGECNAPSPSPPPVTGTSPCMQNGFDHEAVNSQSYPAAYNTIVYAYLTPSEIAPYVDLANTYGIADEVFSGGLSPSFPGHQYLISGLGTRNNPPSSPWGCSEPSGDRVELYLGVPSVFPCFTFPTLATRLDATGVSWKYYTAETPADGWDGLVDAFRASDAVFNSSEYAAKVVPRAQFFTDAVTASTGGSVCTLPGVSWITPNGNASDHAGVANNADGPYWVAQIYETVAQSPCYADTAVLVVWDDSGGWFDHVPPPFVTNSPPPGYRGYRDQIVGMRVPLLFLAPNAVKGVSHTRRDLGAIVGFIEHNFGLAPIGGEDVDFGADHLADMWQPNPTATITPIPISQIFLTKRKPYSVKWFLSQPPAPADDE